jgi:hypothetical protein
MSKEEEGGNEINLEYDCLNLPCIEENDFEIINIIKKNNNNNKIKIKRVELFRKKKNNNL